MIKLENTTCKLCLSKIENIDNLIEENSDYFNTVETKVYCLNQFNFISMEHMIFERLTTLLEVYKFSRKPIKKTIILRLDKIIEAESELLGSDFKNAFILYSKLFIKSIMQYRFTNVIVLTNDIKFLLDVIETNQFTILEDKDNEI